MLRVVAVGEEREVGEVHHPRPAGAQGGQQPGLAQREGSAFQPDPAAAGRGGHAEDRDLAGGHHRSIINALPAALSRDIR